MNDENARKPFPVSWDQFHRDARALAWRLSRAGPFGSPDRRDAWRLVPAAVVARELGIRVIDTLCVSSYSHTSQVGEPTVLKDISDAVARLGGGTGKGLLVVEDLVDTGKTARIVRDLVPQAHLAAVYAKPDGQAAGRHLHHGSVAGHLDLLSVGHGALISAADPGRRGVVFVTSPRVRGEVGKRSEPGEGEAWAMKFAPHPNPLPSERAFTPRLRRAMRGEGEEAVGAM